MLRAQQTAEMRITRPMLGFKAFHSAATTLAGIETAHMIRKGQLGQDGVPPFSSLLPSQHKCVNERPFFSQVKTLRQNPQSDPPIAKRGVASRLSGREAMLKSPDVSQGSN
jgi:hypothetical protein